MNLTQQNCWQMVFFLLDSWLEPNVQVISILDGVEGIRGQVSHLDLYWIWMLLLLHILSIHLLPSYDVFTVRKIHSSLQQLLIER
jgi:hypothetical protein